MFILLYMSPTPWCHYYQHPIPLSLFLISAWLIFISFFSFIICSTLGSRYVLNFIWLPALAPFNLQWLPLTSFPAKEQFWHYLCHYMVVRIDEMENVEVPFQWMGEGPHREGGSGKKCYSFRNQKASSVNGYLGTAQLVNCTQTTTTTITITEK